VEARETAILKAAGLSDENVAALSPADRIDAVRDAIERGVRAPAAAAPPPPPASGAGSAQAKQPQPLSPEQETAVLKASGWTDEDIAVSNWHLNLPARSGLGINARSRPAFGNSMEMSSPTLETRGVFLGASLPVRRNMAKSKLAQSLPQQARAEARPEIKAPISGISPAGSEKRTRRKIALASFF
jgi:hypothetical protein